MNELVLFVDDEEKILRSVARLFEYADLDIELMTANNADKALDIVKRNRVAVVVSDNIMPGMKGADLLASIGTVSPYTVRIMMTGYADLDTSIDAINRGGVYKFIVKPWDNDMLVEMVRESVTKYRMIKSLLHSDEDTLLSLAQTIELKDRYTRGHCDRVARYALAIAENLELSQELQTQIKYGSWLHDCGKIGVSEFILNKAEDLTDDEFDIIKKHPLWGAEVARQAHLSQEVINTIAFHHERFDGRGYPTGMQGEDIPLEARIVSIADVFDAITTDRSYHAKRSITEAIGIMSSLKESAFDPYLLNIFFSCVADIYSEIYEGI